MSIKLIKDFYKFYSNRKREDLCLEKIKNKGGVVITVDDVIGKISNEKDKVCHIIGLGATLNKSRDIIDFENDFLIGMNYGALAKNISYDLYIFEPGNADIDETNIKTELLKTISSNKSTLTIIKNISGVLSFDIIEKYYKNIAPFVKSIVIRCSSPLTLHYWLKRLLKNDGVYFRQYKSTIISAISLAVNAGFKKIVIHGLDFGGAYFFDDKKYIHENMYHLCPPKKSESQTKPIHATAKDKTGAKQSIIVLNELLRKKGIQLYSPIKDIPLSNYLPVYGEE